MNEKNSAEVSLTSDTDIELTSALFLFVADGSVIDQERTDKAA